MAFGVCEEITMEVRSEFDPFRIRQTRNKDFIENACELHHHAQRELTPPARTLNLLVGDLLMRSDGSGDKLYVGKTPALKDGIERLRAVIAVFGTWSGHDGGWRFFGGERVFPFPHWQKGKL